MKKLLLFTLLSLGLIGSVFAQIYSSDTFGTGEDQFSLEFTTIGNPGNAADPRTFLGSPGLSGYGSVGYTYRIGTYAISQSQIDKATASGLQNVVAGAWSGEQPAANISWYEAAAFVNWLNTSQGFHSAYNLTWNGTNWSMSLWKLTDAGYNAKNPYRNSFAKYFLPSESEYYKAAYGNRGGSGYYLYPTASDFTPTAVASGTDANTAVYNQSVLQVPSSIYQAGGRSSYGTMGQGGNVVQWVETQSSGRNFGHADPRSIRGGYSWFSVEDIPSLLTSTHSRSAAYPNFSNIDLGFRVASAADDGFLKNPTPSPAPAPAPASASASASAFVVSSGGGGGSVSKKKSAKRSSVKKPATKRMPATKRIPATYRK